MSARLTFRPKYAKILAIGAPARRAQAAVNRVREAVMKQSSEPGFSRRERQIMDIVYARHRATVGEVLADMADPPSYSSVRALMRILEEKGHLSHETEGTRFVYAPVQPRNTARKSLMRRILRTFFDEIGRAHV